MSQKALYVSIGARRQVCDFMKTPVDLITKSSTLEERLLSIKGKYELVGVS